MGAIIQNYSSAESAVLALQARSRYSAEPYDYLPPTRGCWQLWRMEPPEEHIDESVLRILRLKAAYGAEN